MDRFNLSTFGFDENEGKKRLRARKRCVRHVFCYDPSKPIKRALTPRIAVREKDFTICDIEQSVVNFINVKRTNFSY